MPTFQVSENVRRKCAGDVLGWGARGTMGRTLNAAFVRGYVEAMLWANLLVESADSIEVASPEQGQVADVSVAALREARRDCRNFWRTILAEHGEGRHGPIVECAEYTRDVESMAYAGHCFALSRNGHGAGFFDSHYGDHRALQAIAKSFGSCTWFLSPRGFARGTP